MTVTTVNADAAWWRGYDNACYRAALDQGLAPIALRLAAAKIAFTVDQTGGFCMTIGVYLTEDGRHYIWVTNVHEGTEPGAAVDDLHWVVYRYYDPSTDDDYRYTELAASGTCREAATLIAAELAKEGAAVSPDVEGSEVLYRDAYAQGLSPMALHLAVDRIPFTVERPDGEATVLQIPLTPTTHLWVTAAENAHDPEDLRWRINLLGPITTDEAVAIITAARTKAEAEQPTSTP
ncbi:hypothetical protein [Nonomuraea sp. LPB2021202275-12-8]|uniref:hypothetical protein n=1 Tax=Nonomuraea sp. LPB2021202275-12-8 TaxID=3120159 RepID=UPI00300CF560